MAVGILVLGVAMLSAVATFLNPNEKAAAHLIAGNNYDALCTRSRMFWTIDCWKDGNTEQVLSEKLRDLYEEKKQAKPELPTNPGWAYNKGKKRIEAGEGVYQVDKRA